MASRFIACAERERGGEGWPADLLRAQSVQATGALTAPRRAVRACSPLIPSPPQVQAVTHFRDAAVLAEVSEGLGEAMVGLTAMEQSAPGRKKKRSRGGGVCGGNFQEQ